MISEHSPIRLLEVDWSWLDIKSWIATHWSRHKWECFISTQRTDRTGIERDYIEQSAPVDFEGVANAQQLIDTMRKRLCFCASKETREYAEDLKIAISHRSPELGDVLVPNCVYRFGCPEIEPCGFWKKFTGIVGDMSDLSIQERYDWYNIYFNNEHKNK